MEDLFKIIHEDDELLVINKPAGLACHPTKGDVYSSRISRAEGDFSLLRVRPFTGRKHQIRIHLSHIGHPIVGDKLYGLDEGMYLDFVKGRLTHEQRKKLILPHQALHAEEVEFQWRGEE